MFHVQDNVLGKPTTRKKQAHRVRRLTTLDRESGKTPEQDFLKLRPKDQKEGTGRTKGEVTSRKDGMCKDPEMRKDFDPPHFLETKRKPRWMEQGTREGNRNWYIGGRQAVERSPNLSPSQMEISGRLKELFEFKNNFRFRVARIIQRAPLYHLHNLYCCRHVPSSKNGYINQNLGLTQVPCY